jgi:putative nucleotidyltransferase with HDIG domain
MPKTAVCNAETEIGMNARAERGVVLPVSDADRAHDFNGHRESVLHVPSPGLAHLTVHSYRPPPLLNSAHALQQFWARGTARHLLAGQLPGRWAHTRGVGHRAEQIARVLSPADRSVLVAAAWLHDVGYAAELVDTGFHPLDGARFLAHCGVPRRVCALVAYHSGAAVVAELLGLADQLAQFAEEHGPVRDALWYCDMTTSPDGRPVTFADRIREIRTRRQSDDPVVRALATNGSERAAAVRRTEQLLQTSGTSGEQAVPRAAAVVSQHP